MLRFKILVSVVPFLAAAILARLELVPGLGPCIAVGTEAMQIALSPWRADLHVSFTDEPSLATVRVGLADSVETADFAVVDDSSEAEDGACATPQVTRFVAIDERRLAGAPVIYLSQDGPADYRIFVRSKRLTVREAAALIVGARGRPSTLADASASAS
jgi:hypothetical protein